MRRAWRQHARHWRRWLAGFAVAAVLGGYLSVRAMLDDRPEGNPAVVRVQVVHGASMDEIVESLDSAGLAPHPRLLRWAMRLEGVLPKVQAGIYEIRGDATIGEVLDTLSRAPTVDHVELLLRPARSVWEVARTLAKYGVVDAERLVDRAADHAAVTKLLGPLAHLAGPVRGPRTDGIRRTYLEGFLMPETYFIAPDAALDDVLRRVVGHFRKRWTALTRQHRADILAVQTRYGLSERDLLILASLVDEETGDPDEAPVIAGVFLNRLERGIRLQTDPSLMYQPGRVGRGPTRRERKDARNPYNTYTRDRLPPGPICSPTERALVAVFKPERHDYIFFVARRDGTGRHAFARDLAQHRANIERFLR